MSVVYRWVGPPGGFVSGVPARDLTEDEAKVYGVKKSLYYEREKIDDAPAPPAANEGVRADG